jgi:simple sugar transport system permease protein
VRAAAALGALIYSVVTITFRANQNVTGLALAIFGTGLGNFFGEYISGKSGGYVAVGAVSKAAFNDPLFPRLAEIPVLGKLLFSYNFLVYFAVVLAAVIGIFLKYSRKGLNLRAVGESPSTADAAGICVTRYKYLATLFGGALAGLGGLYVVMNNACGCGGVWTHNGISGYGWLSVALVIFATWSPSRAMLCALAFGGLNVMRYYYPRTWLPSAIYEILPYIATVAVLIAVGVKEIKKNQPPASLGLSYFREER